MSNNTPNNSEDDFEDLEDLENQLKNLVPTNLNADFLDRLSAEQEIAESEVIGQKRLDLRMLAAVVGVCCVALLVINGLNPDTEGVVGNQIEPGELDSLVPSSRSRSNLSNFSFQPVSSEGFLIDASSSRVFQSENGLQRQVELEFQDVDHWHDPTTATNIRIYSPRREVIQVPLRTD